MNIIDIVGLVGGLVGLISAAIHFWTLYREKYSAEIVANVFHTSYMPDPKTTTRGFFITLLNTSKAKASDVTLKIRQMEDSHYIVDGRDVCQVFPIDIESGQSVSARIIPPSEPIGGKFIAEYSWVDPSRRHRQKKQVLLIRQDNNAPHSTTIASH